MIPHASTIINTFSNDSNGAKTDCIKHVNNEMAIRLNENVEYSFPPNNIPYLFIRYDGIQIIGAPPRKNENMRATLKILIFSV